MPTITELCHQAHIQPRGGFLSPRSFTCQQFDDGQILNVAENVPPTTIGLVVDYLTRVTTLQTNPFAIPLRGAKIASQYGVAHGWPELKPAAMTARAHAEAIRDDYLHHAHFSDVSLNLAINLVSYDLVYRTGKILLHKKPLVADAETLNNIRILIARSLNCLNQLGRPTTIDFEVDNHLPQQQHIYGDGDYLSADYVLDMKVSSKPITSAHTLQVLLYYLLGKHEDRYIEFSMLSKLVLFNPRLNQLYTFPVAQLDPTMIVTVERSLLYLPVV